MQVFGPGRLVLALLGALLVTSGCGEPSAPAPPQPYACGTPVGHGHCHASTTVGSHIFGFRTQIKIIEHGNPGNGFITNEFWLLNYSGHNSWIELGYMDDRFSPELQYFFAVNDETGIFTNTIIGYVPKEEIGRVVTFSVHQLSREDRFRISVNGPITRFSTVTDVHMWPGEEGGHVEMGQELAGTTGAKASVAIFDQNFVYVRNAGWQPLVEPLEGPFLAVSRPPFGEWLWPPTMFSREGGLFATRCCTQVP